ncbi:MAG: hypothetical protein DYH15_12280 [Nitrosomonas sp. PRO4]|nr:hypothetical protein [Nitrosomonas sp. PRO4]
MAKDKNQKPDTPEQNAVDIQNDEFRGHGGSYVFDPATGKRTPVGANNHLPQQNHLPEPQEVLNNESE